MSYWYLASPYSHPDQKVVNWRYAKAMEAKVWLLHQGWIIYSPIVSCHQVAVNYALPTDANFWNRMNFGLLAPAEGLIVLEIDGWKESKGLYGELEFALLRGKPVKGLVLDERRENFAFDQAEIRLGAKP